MTRMIKLDFTQKQAAIISGFDDRPFRQRVDRLIIHATPETRLLTRGKTKLFGFKELCVARALSSLRSCNLSPLSESQIADWLRGITGGGAFSAAANGLCLEIYFWPDSQNTWQGHFQNPSVTARKNEENQSDPALVWESPVWLSIELSQIILAAHYAAGKIDL